MSDAAPLADASDLPEDPAALKALLITERRQRVELSAEVARLSAIVAAFKRAMFGRGSEKLDPGQLELALEDTEQTFGEERAGADAADTALKAARRDRQRRTNRGALPGHLPRMEVVIEPESRTGAQPGPLVTPRRAHHFPNTKVSSALYRRVPKAPKI